MQMHQQEILKTERLVLRELSEKDVFVIHELRSDKENRKYIDSPLDKTIRETTDFIKGINKGIQRKEWAYWGIEIAQTQQLIATICLWNFKREYNNVAYYSADVGYEMLANFQGNGYMSEALCTITNHGLNQLQFQLIEAHTQPENLKSIQLLERNNYTFSRFKKVEHSVTKKKYDMAIYQYK